MPRSWPTSSNLTGTPSATSRPTAGAARGSDARPARAGSAPRSSRLRPARRRFRLPPPPANKKMLVVVAGRPTLDTLSGSRSLEPGEVVAFPAGRDGTHRVRNETEEPVRVLIVSTMHAPDINEFPETGEFWVRDYIPGTDPPEGALDVHTKPV